jgi:hypothetical protein
LFEYDEKKTGARGLASEKLNNVNDQVSIICSKKIREKISFWKRTQGFIFWAEAAIKNLH